MNAVDARFGPILRERARAKLMELRGARGAEIVKRFAKYRDDPVAFAIEVLGVTPWSRQAEILRAVVNHDWVAVRSGHKVSKSTTIAILALWWVATRAQGRVILTAPAFHQIKNILWRELRNRYGPVRGRLGIENEDGKIPKDPGTGLQMVGSREIIGISTNQPENLAGLSGPEMFFMIDEGSGYPDDLLEVIEGNSAGGAKVLATSNPTQTSGWFFSAFRGSDRKWHRIHISSRESPNVIEGRVVIKGLATATYIEEMERKYGKEHPVISVRIDGEFPDETAANVIPLHLVDSAKNRWTKEAPREGKLSIGVDVARFGDDETVICAVRGHHAFPLVAMSKADGNEVADVVARLASDLRHHGERVPVRVDGIGVGASVVDALNRHPGRKAGEFEVAEVNVAEASTDGDHSNLRSQIWFGIREWLKEGGTLPNDEGLEEELLCPLFSIDERNRKRVESKDRIKERLERSPDKADALGLAVCNVATKTRVKAVRIRGL